MLLGAFKDRSSASIRTEIYQRGCICENPCDELGDDLVDVGEALGRKMLEAARRVMAMADEMGLELRSEAEVRKLAETAAARVEATFEDTRRRGEIRAYRQKRLEKAAGGRGIVYYMQWVKLQKVVSVVGKRPGANTSGKYGVFCHFWRMACPIRY